MQTWTVFVRPSRVLIGAGVIVGLLSGPLSLAECIPSPALRKIVQELISEKNMSLNADSALKALCEKVPSSKYNLEYSQFRMGSRMLAKGSLLEQDQKGFRTAVGTLLGALQDRNRENLTKENVRKESELLKDVQGILSMKGEVDQKPPLPDCPTARPAPKPQLRPEVSAKPAQPGNSGPPRYVPTAQDREYADKKEREMREFESKYKEVGRDAERLFKEINESAPGVVKEAIDALARSKSQFESGPLRNAEQIYQSNLKTYEQHRAKGGAADAGFEKQLEKQKLQLDERKREQESLARGLKELEAVRSMPTANQATALAKAINSIAPVQKNESGEPARHYSAQAAPAIRVFNEWQGSHAERLRKMTEKYNATAQAHYSWVQEFNRRDYSNLARENLLTETVKKTVLIKAETKDPIEKRLSQIQSLVVDE